MPINAPLYPCSDTMVCLGDADDEVAEPGVDGGLALEAVGDRLGQRPQQQRPQLHHRQHGHGGGGGGPWPPPPPPPLFLLPECWAWAIDGDGRDSVRLGTRGDSIRVDGVRKENL